MAKLKDDHITWVLSLDAKGVQGELNRMSSVTHDLTLKNKELSAEMKKSEKDLREAEKAMERLAKQGKSTSKEYGYAKIAFDQASNSVTSFKKQIDQNNKSIVENDKKFDKLFKTLKVGEMTQAQLTRRARELEMQLRNTAKATEPQVYAALEKELNEVKNRMGELKSGSESTFSIFKGGLMVMAGNLMTKAIDKVKELAIAFKDWVAEGIEAAGVIEGVTRAFNKLDKTGNLLSKLQEQTRNLISDDDLKKAAVRADKYKINIEEVGNLLEFAGRRATDMGRSVQDFQDRIISGIGKESKLILDDLGLTSTEINKAIAETGDFASGVIKVVNEELAKQGQLELTAADIRQQKLVAWANAQGEVGEKFLWLEKIWNKFSIEFANDVAEWAKNTLPALIQKVVDMYNWFVELYNQSALFRGMLNNIVLYYEILWSATKKLLTNTINGWKALGNVIKGVFTLDWDLVKNSTTEFFNSAKGLAIDFADDAKKAWKDYVDEVKNGSREKYTKPLTPESGEATGQTLSKTTDPNATKKQKAAQNLILEEMETEHQKKLFEIKQQYSDGTIKSEADFKRKQFAQEQAYMLLREEALEMFIKRTSDKELKSDLQNKLADLQNKRLDQEIKFRADLEKILLDADPAEKEKRAYQERLHALNLIDVESGEIKKNLTKEQHEALEILEKQHLDKMDAIQKRNDALAKAKSEKEFDEAFKDRKDEMQTELNELMLQASSAGSNSFDADMAVHIKRLQMLQEEIEARRAAGLEVGKQLKDVGRVEAQMTTTLQKEYKKRSDTFQKYSNSLGAAMGDVLSGQKSAFDAFGNAMIDILFDVLTQIINTKIVEATAVAVAEQAKATAVAAAMPDSVATFGVSGAVRSAAIGAIIMGALQAAKGALKGMIGKKSDSGTSQSDSPDQYKRVPKAYAEGGYHDAGTTGGYTGSGGRYEVAGAFSNGDLYHRDEYIIPSPVLKNPAAVPMIRALEAMRAPYSSKNALPDSFAEGGYRGTADSYYSGTSSGNSLQETMEQMNNLLHDLRNDGVSATMNYRSFSDTKDRMDNVKQIAKKQ